MWQLWTIAVVCGACQVFQAMTNGAAARAGLGAVWAGALSATVSALALVLVATLAFKLPLPGWGLLHAQGPRVFIGGLMGATIVAGLAAVAPKLGPTPTFLAYFGVITLISMVIDHYGLLGAVPKPMAARQIAGIAIAAAGLFLARL